MTCNSTCCDSNEEIGNVTKTMGDIGIRRIPVTENGKLVGMLTLGDLAEDDMELSQERVSVTRNNVCEKTEEDDKNAA